MKLTPVIHIDMTGNGNMCGEKGRTTKNPMESNCEDCLRAASIAINDRTVERMCEDFPQ